MKNHLPSAIILFALLLALCLHAFAVDNRPYSELERKNHAAVTINGVALPSSVSVNGVPITDVTTTVVEQSLYLSAVPILSALFHQAQISLQEGWLAVTGDNLRIEAAVGCAYFMVNDRYFYTPHFVAWENGTILLPADTLAQALGCTTEYNAQTGELLFTQFGQPATARTYNPEDLYWLSRAIYSESGNQPMKGRIAVGTVILNRVADENFPNTIKEVIFAPRQFSPVANGTIYLTPDAESIIAAKLCLDGVREAEGCLYFNVTSMVSWADKTRTLYCTIGDHNFYL